MSRRVSALRTALAVFTLAAGVSLAAAAPEVAWELRLLEAPWSGGEPERVELMLDAGSDPLERQLAIKQGVYLRHLTGLPLGRTTELGSATVVFPLGEAFTVESADGGPPFKIDVDPRQDPNRPAFWNVDLGVSTGRRLQYERSVPLHPHRARVWLVPRARGVLALFVHAWPAAQQIQMAERQDTVQLDLALVRGDWRRGVAPGDLREADFPTWLDPFSLEPGESAKALMRPVSAGAADGGTLLFSQSMRVPVGDLAAYERGRRPDGGGPGSEDFLTATLSVREEAEGSGKLSTTVSIQSSLLGSESLVMMRRFVLDDGGTQVWIVPTEDSLNAVFVRATRGLRGLAQTVRPGS